MKNVSKNALLKRINRQLEKAEAKVKTCSFSSRWFHDFGRYYKVDVRFNSLLEPHVCLESLGAELGVIASGESLER